MNGNASSHAKYGYTGLAPATSALVWALEDDMIFSPNNRDKSPTTRAREVADNRPGAVYSAVVRVRR